MAKLITGQNQKSHQSAINTLETDLYSVLISSGHTNKDSITSFDKIGMNAGDFQFNFRPRYDPDMAKI